MCKDCGCGQRQAKICVPCAQVWGGLKEGDEVIPELVDHALLDARIHAREASPPQLVTVKLPVVTDK